MGKRIRVIVLLLFMGLCAWAQAPQKMTYQSVVRDVNNSLATDRSVSARVWILQGSADGAAVYIETQTATTNANGLMTLVIGEGTVVSGSLTAIDWANGPYFLKAEVDPAGGSNYTQVTVQELLSVPYALYAEQSGDGFSGDYNDLTNLPQIPQIPAEVSAFTNDAGYITSFTEQQVLSISHDTLFLTGGSFVKLPAGFDGDYNSLTNTPNLSAVATSGSYSDLDDLPQIPQIPADISTFNNDAGYITSFTEQQVLGISNDTVFLTDGGFVKLPAGFNGDYNSLTNTPNLSAVATSGEYNDLENLPQIPQIPAAVSAFTNDAGYITSFTEQQVLSIRHDTLFLTGGSFVKLPAGFDGDYNSLTNKPNLSAVATSGSYSDLSGTSEIPQIPAEVSDFTNDAGYLTPETVQDAVTIPTNVSAYANDAGYLTPETVQDAVTLLENLSAFTNDAGYIVSGQVPAQVNADWNATEGAAQIVNKPEIPSTANNATLTIQQNEAALGSFSADASSDQTLNMTVPTATSQLGNNAGYITADSLPTGVSAFANDAGYITAAQCGDTSFCEMVNLITSLQTQIGEVQTAISQMGVLLDSLEVVKFRCGTSVVFDYDSNLYHTVQIGNQCWMRENMRTTHYADGTEIPTSAYMFSDLMFRYIPNNDTSLVPTYGYMYNWVAAMHNAPSSSDNPSGVQGVCPMGWHVPSKAEWVQLTDFVGDQVQYACGSDNTKIAKAQASNTGWDASDALCAVGNNPSANNATGFTAFPAGYYYNNPYDFGAAATFWSAGQVNDNYRWAYQLSNESGMVTQEGCHRARGLSVRCLRDAMGMNALLPTVITGSVSDITPATVTCGGEVTADGNAEVTARGICWSTYQHPTLADNYTTDGTGTGLFTSSITGLTPNTTYYVRAYATNSVGTVYGDIQYFTTSALLLPSVTTDSVRDITHTTATCGGEVTSDGGSPVTARGVCWSTSPNPTLADNHTNDGTGTGSFTSNLTDLTPDTRYYVRAYATNSVNTGYGDVYSFRTPALSLPTVTTDSVSDITYTTATCGGEVNSEGDAPVTERGVCWGSNWNPTVDGNHIAVGSGSGVFTTTVTDLTPGTDYYVRAYAISSVGAEYGACMSFRTHNLSKPTVTTGLVSDITHTTATCGSKVTFDGGSPVTARGVCWNTSGNPTLADSHTTDGEGKGVFTSSLTDLAPGTRYLVRAYATNSEGTSYGHSQLFRAVAFRSPKVTTTLVSDVTYTAATCGGEVTDEGSDPVTERGVCWATSDNPTVDSSHIAVGSGSGVFTTTITDLTPDTYYYVRAYATSSAGTVYGVCRSFWTDYFKLPTISSDSISDITTTTAICGGEVTADGGSPVTERGVCWNTFPSPTSASSHTTDGEGLGSFTSSITGLTPNTTYYVWAYATNIAGKNYGEMRKFRTMLLDAPVVITDTVSNITHTTATCGGEVISDGGAPVTARGICWSTSPSPTLADNHTIDGTGTGSFTSNLTELTPNTYYYVRAYATNSAGTRYGFYYTFRTPELSKPTVITDSVGDITKTTAVCVGNVTDEGDAPVTARGFCWGTSLNPTLDDSHTVEGSGAGSFTSSLTDLTMGTRYYVRAYATSSVGTSYGSNLSFTTLLLGMPIVYTRAVYDITINTAQCGGNVYAGYGNLPVTARGICWNTTGDPTLADSHTVDGSGTESFTSNLTNLTPGTTYYVRAYATNSEGTAYGEQVTFTTQALSLPFVITQAASDVTVTSATLGGNVVSDGCSEVTARGICWGTSYNPTLADNYTLDGTGTGEFTTTLTGLNEGTNYYYRAYATNSVGTSYGGCSVFNTSHYRAPTVELTFVGDITGTSVVCSGIVSDEGDAPVTTRGFRWMRSTIPSYDEITVGAGAGSFTDTITGLIPGTQYYVWVFATNSIGVTNGSFHSFTTMSLPKVTTDDISNITLTTAVCGGEVTVDGGSEVTARGICWGLSWNPTLADNHTVAGSGIGNFTVDLTDLTPGTTYYVRAYATNSLGTVYGACKWFETNPLLWATVTTDSVSDITKYSAICGGEVTDDGGTEVTARGVCWGTSLNPTLDDSYTVDGSGVGSFTSSLTGLAMGTYYYVRAYATNSKGTNYGVCQSFRTLLLGPPNVVTVWVDHVMATTAKCKGFVAEGPGNLPVMAHGFCWNTTGDPTLADSYTVDSSGMGYFTTVFTGLTPSTTYYIRAYATNSEGTAYGEQKTFTTQDPSLPDVNTNYYSNVTKTTAMAGGGVTHDGNAPVTARGVCWNTTGDPTLADNYTVDSTGTGEFTSMITGLTPGTRYYYRAYATNSVGTRYGWSNWFTTMPYSRPTVTTDYVTDVSTPTALCVGKVTDEGDAPVTARGICWNTYGNPTVENDHYTTDGTGPGSFSSTLTGLHPGIYYYVRAYATSAVGTSYGTTIMFRDGVNVEGQPCLGSAQMYDVDGNAYNTVWIYDQCWMRENLRTTHYADNTPIAYGGNNTSQTVAYRYYPNNNSGNVSTYGYLYNMAAARHVSGSSNEVQEICPDGWHLPSYNDWTSLQNYLIYNYEDYACQDSYDWSWNIAKALASKTGWISYNSLEMEYCSPAHYPGSNNSTNFTALPAGSRRPNDPYTDFGSLTKFWSNTRNASNYWYAMDINAYDSWISMEGVDAAVGCSVRCIRDW